MVSKASGYSEASTASPAAATIMPGALRPLTKSSAPAPKEPNITARFQPCIPASSRVRLQYQGTPGEYHDNLPLQRVLQTLEPARSNAVARRLPRVALYSPCKLRRFTLENPTCPLEEVAPASRR